MNLKDASLKVIKKDIKAGVSVEKIKIVMLSE